MNCEQFRRLYSDYADGHLDEAAEIEVCGHVSGCPSCARFERALREGLQTLRGLPPLCASSDFDPVLEARILAAARPEPDSPKLPQWSGLVGALMLVVAVGLAGWEVRAARGNAPVLAEQDIDKWKKTGEVPASGASVLSARVDWLWGSEPGFQVVPSGSGGGVRAALWAESDTTVRWANIP